MMRHSILTLMLVGCSPDPGQPDDTGTELSCDEGQLLDSDGTCVPEACGTGTWGAIEGATVFVDSAAEAGGDGGQGAPFTSIQAGLDVAAASGGGTVAVAAGTYAETLSLDSTSSDVVLAGRCRELVTLDASAGGDQTPGIDVQGATTEISGLTVWGSGYIGLRLGRGTATLRQVDIREAAYLGVAAYREGLYAASLELDSCVLADNGSIGLVAFGQGTTVALLDSAVESTIPTSSGSLGFGLQVYDGASVQLDGSVVVGNSNAGILAYDAGTSVILVASTVQGTLANAGGMLGYGLDLQDGAEVTISDSEISGNTGAGIFATGAETTVALTGTTVRDTAVTTAGLGVGVDLYEGATLTAEDSSFEALVATGIHAQGAGTTAQLEGCSFLDIAPTEAGLWGEALLVDSGASLTDDGSTIEAATGAGLLVLGSSSSASLVGTTIKGTLESPEDGLGPGIEVLEGASLEAQDCVLQDNTTTGVFAGNPGTTVRLDDSLIQRTTPNAAGVGGYGVEAYDGATVTLTGSELAENTGIGLFAYHPDTTVTLDDTTVRDTRTTAEGSYGAGIVAWDGGRIEASGGNVSDNHTCGVCAQGEGTTVVLTGTSVQGTQADDDGLNGYGIWAYEQASLLVQDGDIAGNTFASVRAADEGTTVTMEDTTLRDTELDPAGEAGAGLMAHEGATALLERCVVEGNRAVGIWLRGAGTQATLRDTTLQHTGSDAQGEHGTGLEVSGGATALLERCELIENTGVGVLVAEQGTHVALHETTIQDTNPHERGTFGHGMNVTLGASAELIECEIHGHREAGLAADGQGTTVVLTDSTIHNIDLNARYTTAAALVAQFGASIEAEGLALTGNDGPGLFTHGEHSHMGCEACTIDDNRFAGAVALADATLVLTGSSITGTAAQENLGGGVGVYADPDVEGSSPTLTVTDCAIEENPVAGVWLGGPGTYRLQDNTILGGEGSTRNGYTKCGDAVYAQGGIVPWDDEVGLLLASNTLATEQGAGLFLHEASAALGGNHWLDSSIDLIAQGSGCATAPPGYDSEPLTHSELCPTYDYGTCDLYFTMILETASPESGDDEARSATFHMAGLVMPSPQRLPLSPVQPLARTP